MVMVRAEDSFKKRNSLQAFFAKTPMNNITKAFNGGALALEQFLFLNVS